MERVEGRESLSLHDSVCHNVCGRADNNNGLSSKRGDISRVSQSRNSSGSLGTRFVPHEMGARCVLPSRRQTTSSGRGTMGRSS